MSNEELAIQIKDGHSEYCLQLWQQIEKLLCYHIRFYKAKYQQHIEKCGLTDEDILQELYFAMLKAVKAFDSSTGYKFNTYLKYHIKNCIHSLLGFRGKSDTLNKCVSFDELVSDYTEDGTFLELIADETSEDAFSEVEDDIYISELRKILDKAISNNLTAVEANRLKKYYFEGLNIRQISAAEGCSHTAINNTIHIGIEKIRRSEEGRQLKEYCDFDLYNGNGLNAYKNRGCSTVELYAELREKGSHKKFTQWTA